MDNEVLKKLYYKIMYNQKLISENSVQDLIREEKRIYGDLEEKEKINYEVNRLNKHQYLIKDSLSLKIFKSVSLRIEELLDEEKPDFNNIKKLVVILDILLNISPSFYKSLKEIDKDYLSDEFLKDIDGGKLCIKI